MSTELMEAAGELARLTGDVALAHFRKEVQVDLKEDQSPVTEADRRAESQAREWLTARFPQDGILGEEFGETRPNAARRWILDPIDGTRTFIRGVPLWGTLVAVASGEQVLAGAAYFPAVGELLVAAPGQGAFHDGKRCRVSSVATLEKACVLTTDPKFPLTPERGERFRRLERAAGQSRSWGDCYGYLLLATGRAEVMVDGVLSAWDAAALQPIIEEAGGRFTDFAGRRSAFGGSAIATNAALDAAVREILCQGER